MISKFDVDDEVLIKAKVAKVKSCTKGKIEYSVLVKHMSNCVVFDETEISDATEAYEKGRADVIDEVLEIADRSVTLSDLCGGLRLIQKNIEEQKNEQM